MTATATLATTAPATTTTATSHLPRRTDLHSDVDVLTVAEGLVRVAGTAGAAQQLRRLYGEQRAAEVLLAAAGGSPTAGAAVPRTGGHGAILDLAHPRHRLAAGRRASRAYGPRPLAGGRTVYWL
jgi:hypothetical protein